MAGEIDPEEFKKRTAKSLGLTPDDATGDEVDEFLLEMQGDFIDRVRYMLVDGTKRVLADRIVVNGTRVSFIGVPPSTITGFHYIDDEGEEHHVRFMRAVLVTTPGNTLELEMA